MFVWLASFLVILTSNVAEVVPGQYPIARQSPSYNPVISFEKAKEDLIQYGYLYCPQQPCEDHALLAAVRGYQITYDLPVTGYLNALTLQHLSEPRCGNPDDESAAVPYHNQYHLKKRRTQSILRRATKFRWRHQRGLHARTRVVWLQDHAKKIASGELDRSLARVLSATRSRMLTRRWKRSALNNGQAFVSDMVTWRLVDDGYTYQLSDANQRSALALAFRMWSEVIPILFLEDTKSPVYDVDILIGFRKDWHLNCPKKFDGRGGTLAHALRRLTATEIHFDDAEILTVNGSGTDLVRLALHEIGHALGLYHSGHNNSAMFPVYQGRFELAWEDRALAQSIYGVCRGSFNTVFDLVRTKPDGKQIYNTFFFRGDHYWLYVNRSNRTRYGDPLQISRYWKGAPSYLDAAVHIFGTTRDLVYLFKGRHFWLYNSTMDQVAAGYPKNISDHFRAIPGSGSRSIPNFLDAVFFDHRDGNLYFFKGNKVYGYDLSRGEEGCCLPGYPRSLSQEFPISKGRRPLPKRLDSVYYSYTDGKMYLMRGSLYWVNIDFDLSSPRRNLVVGPRDIAKRWKDICDVDL